MHSSDSSLVRRMAVIAAIVELLAISGAARADSVSPQLARDVAGTYSSFSFNKEGGDLLGYELRLIPTADGLRAVVQMAEGVAGDVILSAVEQVGGKLRFAVPLKGDGVAEFEGFVTDLAFVGTVDFGNGTIPIRLKRGRSYWDK